MLESPSLHLKLNLHVLSLYLPLIDERELRFNASNLVNSHLGMYWFYFWLMFSFAIGSAKKDFLDSILPALNRRMSNCYEHASHTCVSFFQRFDYIQFSSWINGLSSPHSEL